MLAGIRGREAAVAAQKLIERQANVNAQSQKGITPLHVSLEHLNSDLYFVLIVNGADETISDCEGRRPIDHHSRQYVVKNISDPSGKDIQMTGDQIPILDDFPPMDSNPFERG